MRNLGWLRRNKGRLAPTLASLAFLGMFLAPVPSHAVPSFARQTGLACEACHTVFPELTPFGRRFKLNGYVLSTRSSISDMDTNKRSTLSIQDLPPLSVMLQASSSWTKKSNFDTTVPGSIAQNGMTQFPQQFSLFYAGKVSDNLGAFIQSTYQQQTGTLAIDNTDIRLTDHTVDNDWVYGLTLNNNPSVQDVWNSTPAWGFPFYNAPSAIPAPSAKPLINSLGGNSAGLGAYVYYKDAYYLEVAAYRSALQGISHTYDSTVNGNSVIDNFAPYWRAAYEKQWGKNALELGTFGIWSKYQATNSNGSVLISPGTSDTYLDTAVDLQYQFLGDNNNFSVQGSYLRESVNRNLSSASPTAFYATTYLNRLQLAANYFYRRKYGGSVGITKVSGTRDSVLYAASTTTSTLASGTGSYAKNKPDSQFEVVELDYMPWLNTKVLFQYTIYNQFNGGSNGYDGSTGRKASDNNTAMVALWLAF